MKKLFLLFLIISQLGFAQKLSKSQREAVMYDLVEKYNPDAAWMLRDLIRLPGKYKIDGMSIKTFGSDNPARWITGRTEADVVESLSTVIHESIHGYTSEKHFELLMQETPENYAFKDDYSAFFIDQNKIILVKHTDCYNSHELKRDIPKALQTFRYDPYIVPKDNLGSQVQGIYGLLDEFNAYYQGANMVYKMIPYYESLEDPYEGFQEFVSNFSSDRLAFYEFTFFTLSYLIRSNQQYPDEFQKIMENQALREAYFAIYTGFLDLDRRFDQKLKEKIEEFNASGKRARIENDFFYVGNYGVGMQSDEIELLKAALDKTDYRKMLERFLNY